jgi:rare lipoprotein A
MRHCHSLSLTAVIILFTLLAACAPKVMHPEHPPAKQEMELPAKRVPPGAIVPPTQRPYRINGKTYYPLPSAEGFSEAGIASWYGRDFHGKKTSNGETYDMFAMTAAHKTLPMNTFLLVKNLDNGKEISVRVNDRGPFVKGRIIDLSNTAAREIDMLGKGTARVRITALGEAVQYNTGSRSVERFLPHQDFEKGDFFVQIGSFTDIGNAERLKQKMLSMGKKAVMQTVLLEGETFYRIQVRGGNTLTAAKHMERVMGEAGYPDAFVVAR